MRAKNKLLLALVGMTFVALANAQTMGKGGSEISGGAGAEGGGANATKSLERCSKKLGTLAVVEPQDYMMKALSQFSLPSPTQMIRVIVQQSGCFAVVERGIGMQNLMQERALQEGGQLRNNQNVGKGQMVTADYVMTPDIMFKNNNAGGVGGFLGGLLGPVGAVVGGAIKFKSAQVTLTMADTRSSLQVGAATGSSEATDFGLGGALGMAGGGLGLGAYENTAEGKVVAMAFLDAYNQLVATVRGNSELARDNAALSVASAGRNSMANQVRGGDVGRAKIGGVSVFKSYERKSVAYKLTKDEEVVILGEKDGFLEVQAEKGSGWVDVRMIAR